MLAESLGGVGEKPDNYTRHSSESGFIGTSSDYLRVRRRDERRVRIRINDT